MDWQQIIWAGVLAAFLVMGIPAAKRLMQQTPEAEAGDWNAFILPIILVAAFVMLLMWLV
jgi:hypothetical protein